MQQKQKSKLRIDWINILLWIFVIVSFVIAIIALTKSKPQKPQKPQTKFQNVENIQFNNGIEISQVDDNSIIFQGKKGNMKLYLNNDETDIVTIGVEEKNQPHWKFNYKDSRCGREAGTNIPKGWTAPKEGCS